MFTRLLGRPLLQYPHVTLRNSLNVHEQEILFHPEHFWNLYITFISKVENISEKSKPCRAYAYALLSPTSLEERAPVKAPDLGALPKDSMYTSSSYVGLKVPK